MNSKLIAIVLLWQGLISLGESIDIINQDENEKIQVP